MISLDLAFHAALKKRLQEREGEQMRQLRIGYDDFAGYRYASGYLRAIEEILGDAADIEEELSKR